MLLHLGHREQIVAGDPADEVGVVVPDVIFVYLAWSIASNRSASNAYRVKKVALGGMTVGLLVFIGGAF